MALNLDDLIEAMEDAMGVEWRRTHDGDLPSAGAADRRLILAAVSRGLLTYLQHREDDVIRTITFEDGGDRQRHEVVALNLDIDLGD